ncbi:MAG TPA: methyltransferase domain-containing protein [Bryobacteraceae bacterium]|nr:methyltransferase domain-containing protein [Bryobacteraceae bacterium]HOQ46094.1 methyltransferase domain-containing protein [Bryobacteraceae bacterium]HPQ15801.1 methyltransferase domain-containing protein [Bryobacteraceae bacterium]HPU72795.1 methyltransferase domain-containing protein [Bryobacteraceae bacterium]
MSAHALPSTAGRMPATARMPGHWLLARLGKCVLRPGGVELTGRMLAALNITPQDDVVEFAPGLGLTARAVLARNPRTYTAVEQDAGAAERMRRWLPASAKCLNATAERTGLPSACASALYGEAMLSMQTPEQKRRIVQEAFRLLRPGGRYGIHELCAVPDDLPASVLKEMERRMSLSIHVGVRLLTSPGWRALLEECGFIVEWEARAPMHLLEPRRVLRDEGLRRTLKILFNMIRDGEARARVREMRGLFRSFGDHLSAISLVARKPSAAA